MEAVFEMVNLSDDDEIFRGYTTMKELYNALKFITMLLFIQNILTFNLVVAFLKSVSIFPMELHTVVPANANANICDFDLLPQNW